MNIFFVIGGGSKKRPRILVDTGAKILFSYFDLSREVRGDKTFGELDRFIELIGEMECQQSRFSSKKILGRSDDGA